MNQKQRTITRRALWTIGFAAFVAAAVTAWNLNEQRIRNHRDEGLVRSQVLVSGDGRTVTADVLWQPCSEPLPELGAHESASTVALVARTGTSNGQLCRGTAQQISMVLRAPLGNRRLLDLAGVKLAPFPAAQLATPGYLPPGYAPTDIIDLSHAGEHLMPEAFANPGSPASWNRNFRKGPAGPVITIAQELAPAHPLGRPTTPVPVHGLPGRYAETPGPAPERVITWTDRGDTFTILTTDPSLTKPALLHIAAHLGR